MQDLNNNQIIFKDMVLGILVYAVVLGFFNDYTDILKTTSYSVTFAVAITMQILVYLTILLKNKVVSTLKSKFYITHKAIIGFFIWVIMFFSKFVFLAVIDILFGDTVEVSGFVGLMIVIIIVTLVTELLFYIQRKLAHPD